VRVRDAMDEASDLDQDMKDDHESDLASATEQLRAPHPNRRVIKTSLSRITHPVLSSIAGTGARHCRDTPRPGRVTMNAGPTQHMGCSRRAAGRSDLRAAFGNGISAGFGLGKRGLGWTSRSWRHSYCRTSQRLPGSPPAYVASIAVNSARCSFQAQFEKRMILKVELNIRSARNR